MKTCSVAGIGILVSLLLGFTAPASAQFEAVAKYLPAGANVLFLINVEKALASPLAASQGWREKEENAFASGLTFLPPGALHFAMAQELDIELMQPIWQASVLDVNFDPSMPKLAAKFKGSVDQIEDRAAAVLPPDTYVVQFAQQVVGIMSPANRQKVAHWVKSVYSKSPPTLSPYLTQAENYADKGAPFILAIDLGNAMSLDTIRDHVQRSDTFKGGKFDLDKICSVLATIRGATLGLTISDHIHGAVRIDFTQNIGDLKDFVQPYFLEVLANQGAEISELASWQPKYDPQTFQLRGTLEPSGMRRLMSLLDTPNSLHMAPVSDDPLAQPAAGQQDPKQLIALASQQHFKAVQGYLKDLRKEKREARSMGQIGLWFDKYATKIENLPILNVDTDLVKYSADVADKLHQAHGAIATGGEEAAVRQADAPNVVSYNYKTYGGMVNYGWAGSYGGYAVMARPAPWRSLRLKDQQLAQIREEEKVKSGSAANSILEQVEEETGQVRRQMTERYGVEF